MRPRHDQPAALRYDIGDIMPYSRDLLGRVVRLHASQRRGRAAHHDESQYGQYHYVPHREPPGAPPPQALRLRALSYAPAESQLCLWALTLVLDPFFGKIEKPGRIGRDRVIRVALVRLLSDSHVEPRRQRPRPCR